MVIQRGPKRDVKWRPKQYALNKLLGREPEPEPERKCSKCNSPISDNAFAATDEDGELCLGCFVIVAGMRGKRPEGGRP